MVDLLILEYVQEGPWSVYAGLPTTKVEKGKHHGDCDDEERYNGVDQFVRGRRAAAMLALFLNSFHHNGNSVQH